MSARRKSEERHPAGTAAGAAAGAVAGNSFAAEFDADEEARYWRENYKSRPYRRPDRGFSYYEPAYRYGWESARRYDGDARSFEEAEKNLSEGWLDWMVGDSSPGHEWRELREAVRDAWRRIRGR